MTAVGERKTVLVVDDEEDVREYLEAVLEDAGFVVETAVDGEDALAKVRANPPDLVSLDLVMPKKSGIKFLYEIKHRKELAKIPVIIVTAHAHDDLGKDDLKDALSGKGLVAPGGYLEKPVQPEAYVRMVCSSLGVAYEELTHDELPVEQLRDHVEGLLEGASAEQLAEMARVLKSKGTP
ncbi:MAG: response regulator [Acidobacteriota bacterium]|nr:response regulator [Acidobacteriota bacterium]